jgi:hypothetical protein
MSAVPAQNQERGFARDAALRTRQTLVQNEFTFLRPYPSLKPAGFLRASAAQIRSCSFGERGFKSVSLYNQ